MIIAEYSGGKLTHLIREDSKIPKSLIRSNIKSRRSSAGQESERASNKTKDFFCLDEFIDSSSNPTPEELSKTSEPNALYPSPETPDPHRYPPKKARFESNLQKSDPKIPTKDESITKPSDARVVGSNGPSFE